MLDFSTGDYGEVTIKGQVFVAVSKENFDYNGMPTNVKPSTFKLIDKDGRILRFPFDNHVSFVPLLHTDASLSTGDVVYARDDESKRPCTVNGSLLFDHSGRSWIEPEYPLTDRFYVVIPPLVQKSDPAMSFTSSGPSLTIIHTGDKI